MIDTRSILLAFLIYVVGNIVHVKNANEVPELDECSSTYSSSDEPNAKVIPPDINLFNRHVLRSMKQSQRLSEIFDFEGKISTTEWASAKFYCIIAVLIDFKTPDAVSKIGSAINRVGYNCEKLTPDFIKTVNIGSITKYLHFNDFLNCNNAVKLAKSYVERRELAVDKFYNEKCPRSKLATLTIGYLEFLLNENLVDSQNETQFSKVVRSWAEEYVFQANLQKGNACYSPKKQPSLHASQPILEPEDRICEDNSQLVKQFTETFLYEVKQSSHLTELFNLSHDVFDNDELSRASFYLSIYHLQRLGASEPAMLADFMSRFIQDIKYFQSDTIARHRSTFLAKYLSAEKFLNSSNSEFLAIKFSKVMENRARTIMNAKYQRSKMVVTSFALRDFLTENNFLHPSQGSKLAWYYGNEWRCLSNNCPKKTSFK